MRVLAVLLLCLSVFSSAHAQEAEDDKTFLENKLQEVLSGVGREVRIAGFEGALSSNARLRQMTISDANGVWLTMRDAQLIWTRSALLRGRLEIEDISAAEIEISRLPSSESELTVADTEAAPFALPELPVSVNIDAIEVGTITLAPSVIGEAATLTLAGNLRLDGGDGDAKLDILRTDRDDQLSLEGGFSNQSRVLRLNLDFVEAENGMVSTLLNIPGAPSLELKIEGEAPISDYTAQITLASDDQPRFGGQVRLTTAETEGEANTFQADLSGDLRPLFAPELHPFFGEASRLLVEGQSISGGATTLETFELSSGALNLEGQLTLNAEGWPDKFALNGKIDEGEPIRLPTSGPATFIERAEISAGFDTAQGDRWNASVKLNGLQQEGTRFAQAELVGEGLIARAPNAAVLANLTYSIQSLQLPNPDLTEAIGSNPSGRATLAWKPEEPLSIAPLIIESDGLKIEVNGKVDQLSEGLPVQGITTLEGADLARFSAVAQRDLAGAIRATIKGSATLLSGAFDVVVEAETNRLAISQPRLDPILKSKTALTAAITRDETGTELKEFSLTNQDAAISATGVLNTETGRLNLSSRLADVSLVEPNLSGDSEARAQVSWQSGTPVIFENLYVRLADAVIEADGQIDITKPTLPAEGELTLVTPDLSRFAALAARPLAGQIDLRLKGSGEIQGETLDVGYEIAGSDLRTGIGTLDQLLAGALDSTGNLAVLPERLDLQYFKLATPRLRVNASGGNAGEPVAVAARLSDLAILTGSISGPAEIRGTVMIEDRMAERLQIDVNATGPGGVVAKLVGAIRDYGNDLSLAVNGTAPLQLANQFISPRSIQGDAQFDFRVDGPAQLSSLSGTLTFADARAALPQLDYSLSELSGTIGLGAGSAEVDVSGTAGKGGRFVARGPVALSAPYPARLSVELQELGLTDFELYYTTLNGGVSVNGPLLGGALVSGTINLGKTELRVPSGSGVIIGTLPELRHVGEPADVALTRKRAGLTGVDSGPSASFPIDLLINAPNRIFVRGRGLDAELGGRIRLSGSTSDVAASGVFELIRGRLDILGKRLDIVEGLIDMRGSLDPFLRFVAETAADDVLVQVIVEGLASEPSVTFTSQPDLPQEEVVARLLFGRGLDTISPFQAAQLVSAVATLTGRYSGGLVGRLRSSLGLSDLDISTTDEGATQVRAGAYISENIYSEVTADSEGKQQINLNLDLSKSVTVRGRADNEGDTGIGIFFEKDY